MKKLNILSIIMLLISFVSINIARAEEPSKAELLQMIKSQQNQIESLATAIEEGSSGSGWWEKTSVGGYGELHANFKPESDDMLDFHRFVLFVNHDYNNWVSLFTELELEHSLAGDGKPGEVELEQAFIRLDWSEQFSTDVGLFLMPIGILNETHEPDTFYGVERNNVEKYIIPTTWWQGGVKAIHRFNNGLSLEGAITDGMNTGSKPGYIRGGRQKVAEAILNQAAISGRARYTGIPGLDLGVSFFYQSDMDQTDAAEYSGLLTSFHAIYKKGNFGLRALYAQWELSGDIAEAAKKQSGYYIEPSYRWNALGEYGDLGVFVRLSDYDYYAFSDDVGSLKTKEYTTFGLNYWPTDGVVLKADVQKEAADNDHTLNLGVGFQF